ncbi:MAG: glycosyltransferase family 4 protein [Candidatus Moraniibacteriota bacterium]|nr:MAG: glycosyltransferase family 4 protein [Candidatus Moranbacteria bacterium]
MRIGIDARTILNPEHGDAIGSGHYTYQLIRHLIEEDKKNEYVLFFDYRVREKDIKKFSLPHVSVRFYPFSDYKKYLPGAYSEILGLATITREKLDILHSTSVMSRIPLLYKGACVTTIHSLGAFVFPEMYSIPQRIREQSLIRYMVKKSDHIISASQFLSDEIVEKFGVKKKKISVVYAGVDERFFKAPTGDGADFRVKHKIATPYALFLGTLSPINNITRLLEAFALFLKMKGVSKDFTLVVAGKSGWFSEEYRQVAKDLGILSRIAFTGYVVGDDLLPLFHNAEFFIMPSLYEGFGSTVLEALATGTPTIATKASSIPEIARDAVTYIDPRNIQEMAQTMNLFVKNEKLRHECAQKGIQQAKNFSWKQTAKKTLEVYKNILKK